MISIFGINREWLEIYFDNKVIWINDDGKISILNSSRYAPDKSLCL